MSETICLIDGDGKALKRNREILEMFGYKVVAAGGVDGALPHIAGGAVDLVISDAHPLGLSGIVLLEKMRGIKSRVPVLLLGRSLTEEVVEQAAAGGAIGFLEKPVSTVTLVAFIQELFGFSNGNGNGKVKGNGKLHSCKAIGDEPNSGNPLNFSGIKITNGGNGNGRNEKPNGATAPTVPAGQMKKNWLFRLFGK